MKSIIQFFVTRFRFSLFLSLLIVIFGIIGLSTIKTETRPPVDFARASITTSFPGASAEEVENEVTRPIEEKLSSIKGLDKVFSTSSTGLSSITIFIDSENYTTQEVVDDIRREIHSIPNLPKDLPDDPIVSYFDSKIIPILRLVFILPENPRKYMQLAYELKESIKILPGVAGINMNGYQEEEVQILLDPHLLAKHYVDYTQVLRSIRTYTQNIPSGYIRSSKKDYLIRLDHKISGLKQIENIIVRTNFSNKKILLKDIAKIQYAPKETRVLVKFNGKQAITLNITKSGEADIINTVDLIKAKVKSFKKRWNLKEEDVKWYIDESFYVRDMLSIIIGNLSLGLILIVLIISLFLPGYLSIFSSLSLLFSSFSVIALMVFFGININIITMLSMIVVIGMLVDNSIVISENYVQFREKGFSNSQAAVEATYQFWKPLTMTILTTIVAFVPMLLTTGVMGQFIRWIPILISIALLVSLVEALFLLPARLQFSVTTLKQKKMQEKFNKFKKFFEIFLSKCLKKPLTTLSMLTSIFIISTVASVMFNHFELFPPDGVDAYIGELEIAPNSDVRVLNNAMEDISHDIIQVLGKDLVQSITATSGLSISLRRVTSLPSTYKGSLTIILDKKQALATNTVDIVKKLSTISHPSLVKIDFDALKGGPPTGQALHISLLHNNTKKLENYSKQLIKKLSQLKGITSLKEDKEPPSKEFKLLVDFKKMNQLNINIDTLKQSLRGLFYGTTVDTFVKNNKSYDINLILAPEFREQLKQLDDVSILNGGGQLIPLSHFVDYEKKIAPKDKNRFNFKPFIAITAGVDNIHITSRRVTKKAIEIVDSFIQEDPLLSYNVGGEAEQTQKSLQSLKIAMVVALVCIFALLVLLFNSFLLPFLVIQSVPLGFIGINFIFLFHGRPLSFMALIGVVGLTGVIVNSSIVLISYIEQCRAKDPSQSIDTVLTHATSHRLRAVTITTLTTLGGLLPTAYGLGGYSELMAPVTLALAWGLFTGTTLSLLWTPCAYKLSFHWIQKIKSFRYLRLHTQK